MVLTPYSGLSKLYSVPLILSPDNMARTVAKMKTMCIKLKDHDSARRSAVLIPLCTVNNEICLLYTLRTQHLRSHKGQVSFPGGMQDDNDADLIETALRETEEELGMKRENLRVWGSGNLIQARGVYMLPVVGQILGDLDISNLNINKDEVKEVFVVRLVDLCDRTKLGYTQFRDQYSTPTFTGGHRKIWGLTAIVTNMFLKALFPDQVYNHPIKFVHSWRAK